MTSLSLSLFPFFSLLFFLSPLFSLSLYMCVCTAFLFCFKTMQMHEDSVFSVQPASAVISPHEMLQLRVIADLNDSLRQARASFIAKSVLTAPYMYIHV